MENNHIVSFKLILGGALLGAFLVPVMPVFAYDQKNTHPALTDEIVDFYNLNFPDKKITDEEKRWLIKGSMDEDIGERPLFHFYDPVYNRGILTLSSKEWALKDGAQAAYYNSQLTGFAAISGGDSANDFSYQRALRDYSKSDRERAFISFGHILHLLEDAGVPDHTRNDAHPPFIHTETSPYEHEMIKWNPQNFQIANLLFWRKEKPVLLHDMGSYFDKIANYSNNNFFSKDTISNETYNKPNINITQKLKINGAERLFIVGGNKDKTPLAFIDVKFDNGQLKIEKPQLISGKIGSYILDGYWDRLSKEIVTSGAGALNLFLQEAEKAKEEYAKNPPEKPSFWAQLLRVFGIGDDGDGKLMISDNRGTSDVNGVNKIKLFTLPTSQVGSPQVTGGGDKVGDISLSPLASPLSPVLSPFLSPRPSMSPLVSPSPIPTPVISPTIQQKVNINTASKEELMTLKGIKDAKSDAIIQYRQINGQFQKIEDIMNVSGIGPATFAEIRDLITVGNIVLTPSPVFSSGGGGGGGGVSSSPTPTPSPSVTPTSSPTPTSLLTEKININTASKEQLMTLPGIGDVKSNAIINYRTTTGPFKKIEDIMNVSGIGTATFDKIKDLITVGDVTVIPSAVTDLIADHHSPTVTATWSAPDPGTYNPASLSYDLRYSTVNFTDDATWEAAIKIASSSLPDVGEKGASQSASFDVAYEYGRTLYFALKTGFSGISNIASVSFPTATISISPNSFTGNVPTTITCPDGLSWNAYYPDGNEVPNSHDACKTSGTNYDGLFNENTASSYILNLFSGELPNGIYTFVLVNNSDSSALTPLSDERTNPGYLGEITIVIEQPVDDSSVSGTKVWEFDAGFGNAISQPVADADGNVYFGAADSSSGKLIKLNKDGIKQWEYETNVSIGTPAVLSDGTVYFGRVGAGGVLAFTALNPDGSKKWDYNDASTVRAVAVSSSGEPHFTYTSGIDKLLALNIDGSAKVTINSAGLSGFIPVVLNDGTIITASKVSGNQFFTSYSSNGTQLWQVFYTGTNGSTPANPLYDQATGTTYSAAGPKLFDIPSDGSILNTTSLDTTGIGVVTTMVSITSNSSKIFVGMDKNISIPASGSELIAIDKSSKAITWRYAADSSINQQIAVDGDGNIYFSTKNGKLYSVDPAGALRWTVIGSNSDISPILTENGLVWGYGNKVIFIHN